MDIYQKLNINDMQKKRIAKRIAGYFKTPHNIQKSIDFISEIFFDAIRESENTQKTFLLKKHKHNAIIKYYSEIEEYINLGYGSQKIKTLLESKKIKVGRNTLQNFINDYKTWSF